MPDLERNPEAQRGRGMDVDQNEPDPEAQEEQTTEDQHERALEVPEGRAMSVHQQETQVSSLHLKCTHGHGNETGELRRCSTRGAIRRRRKEER